MRANLLLIQSAGSGKKLWEFDTNPEDFVWPRTHNNAISTAVIYDNKVYIANGQNPEHREGVELEKSTRSSNETCRLLEHQMRACQGMP